MTLSVSFSWFLVVWGCSGLFYRRQRVCARAIRRSLLANSINFVSVAEMIQRVPHGRGGDLDHTVERHIQFHDQENRSRHRQCRQHERNNDRAVWWRKQAYTREDDREPSDENDQHGDGYRAFRLLKQQPAHLPNIGGDLHGLRLERALGVVLW